MDIDDGSADNCTISSMQISQSKFDCSDVGFPNKTSEVMIVILVVLFGGDDVSDSGDASRSDCHDVDDPDCREEASPW